MTMQFRTVKAAIVTILGAAEASRYRTIGYQGQTKNAQDIKGTQRTVRVYYQSGQFPKAASSIYGPCSHDIAFNIELSCSEPAKADLTVLDNPASTPAQKQAALLAASTADLNVDDSFDEFLDIIYQVLMDARNNDFGLTNQVSNRFIDSMEKNPIARSGELGILTGGLRLTLRVQEQVTGDVGVPLEDVITDIKVENQTAVTGVKVTY